MPSKRNSGDGQVKGICKGSRSWKNRISEPNPELKSICWYTKRLWRMKGMSWDWMPPRRNSRNNESRDVQGSEKHKFSRWFQNWNPFLNMSSGWQEWSKWIENECPPGGIPGSGESEDFRDILGLEKSGFLRWFQNWNPLPNMSSGWRERSEWIKNECPPGEILRSSESEDLRDVLGLKMTAFKSRMRSKRPLRSMCLRSNGIRFWACQHCIFQHKPLPKTCSFHPDEA